MFAVLSTAKIYCHIALSCSPWFIILLSFARGKLVNALCREENALSLGRQGRQPMLTVARPVALSQTQVPCFSREAVTKNSADLVYDWWLC